MPSNPSNVTFNDLIVTTDLGITDRQRTSNLTGEYTAQIAYTAVRFPQVSGVQTYKLASPHIHWNKNQFSHVIATASECTLDLDSEALPDFCQPYIGGATVQVSNIAVQEGLAEIRFNVEWGGSLYIYLQVQITTFTKFSGK